jgi:hypothetical protein
VGHYGDHLPLPRRLPLNERGSKSDYNGVAMATPFLDKVVREQPFLKFSGSPNNSVRGKSRESHVMRRSHQITIMHTVEGHATGHQNSGYEDDEVPLYVVVALFNGNRFVLERGVMVGARVLRLISLRALPLYILGD